MSQPQNHIVIEDPSIQEDIINYASLKLIMADAFPARGRLDDWKVVQNDGGERVIKRVCDLQDIAGESYPMKGDEIAYSLGEGRWNIGEIIVEIKHSEKIFVVGHNLMPHRWMNLYGDDLEIRKFLGEVYNHANTKEHNYIKVYGPNQKGFWDYLFQNPRREVDTVFIGGKNEILADLDEFFGSERDYLYFGHPYKRNYLFHGPPGNGKTSFINAIAGKYNLNVFLISFSVNITDEVFKKLISGLNKNSLLVMEDIDVLFQSGGGGGGGGGVGGKNITMSTILNTLDGLARKNRIICIMSTNHFDVLTDVFKRPGRLDMLVEFKNADKKCFEEMAEFIVKYHGGERGEVEGGGESDHIKMAGDFYDEIAFLNPSRALAQKFLFENRTKRINELFSSAMSKKFREMHDLFINKKDVGGNLYL
jgi:DNA polymerase III delta prime subunit